MSIPNTFTSDTKAVAFEVNANFDAVQTGINDNDSRIAALEEAIAALQTTVASQQTAISDLEDENATLLTRLEDVEANSVLDLDGYLTFGTDNS
ncbi:MAG: hypothetical protein PVG41_15595, partial [Desulfobacteraceae bacterium]